MADYEAYTHVELQGRSASISSYSPSSGYTYRTEEDILDEMKRDKIISYHRTRARFEEIDRVVKLFAERKRIPCDPHVLLRRGREGQRASGRRGAVHMGNNSRRAGRNGADPRREERADGETKSLMTWPCVCSANPRRLAWVHTGRSGTEVEGLCRILAGRNEEIKTGRKMPVSRPFRALVCTVHICYNYYAD